MRLIRGVRSYAAGGTALAGTFLATYFAFAASVGFDGPPASWEAYGEPPVGPPVEQPICFWTDLAFVVAGVAALRRLDRAAAPSGPAIGFGFLLVWMGPASMLEHGTLRTTWGWFDATSIHWFATYVVAWLALRALPGRGRSRTILFFAGLAATWAAIGAWTWRVDGARMLASEVLLALAAAALVAAVAFGRAVGLRLPQRAWAWAALAAAAFAAGVALLDAGRAGGWAAPWGHGAWHCCCAAATYLVFRLLEEPPERSGDAADREGVRQHPGGIP